MAETKFWFIKDCNVKVFGIKLIESDIKVYNIFEGKGDKK